MAGKKRWEKVEFSDGVQVMQLTGYKFFSALINQTMIDFPTYIWRGQRCDYWKLQPTLDRILTRNNTQRTRNEHLERFKYATRGRRGVTPPPIEEEDDWWALGQHNGLATPLLDWTRSPYVAAYFAFMEESDGTTKNRAIYAISEFSLNQKSEELLNNGADPNDVVKVIRPFSDENPRLVNQAGLFTKAPAGIDIETWIRNHFRGEKNYVKLKKILIPDSDREFVLRSLNKMNINHLTLFPDLYGASKFANLELVIEKY